MFCAFVCKEIASVLWCVFTEEARQYVDLVPFTIDFEKEATGGSAETIPKYRRLGIHKIHMCQEFKFVHERGLNKKYTVPMNSKGHAVHLQAGSRICGEMTYWNFFGWKFWKEKLVKQKNLTGSPTRIRT